MNVKRKKQSSCVYVKQLTIDCEGNVVLCCNDYNSNVVFGNISTSEISSIWNDKYYKKVRESTSRGVWLFDMCRKCAGDI